MVYFYAFKQQNGFLSWFMVTGHQFVRLFLLSVLLFVSAILPAQDAPHDLMVKKNGTILEVTIVETRSDEILYRKKSEPEGPIYAIEKADLLSIKYRNGETVTFTLTIDNFYESKSDERPIASSVEETITRYPQPVPKNEFQRSILALSTDGLEPSYQRFRQASRKGKKLGLTATVLHVGVNLLGTILIASNSYTDSYGNTVSSNDNAVLAGSMMVIGGSLTGFILGPLGFTRAAKNGNRAKFIRNEAKRRGVVLKN